MIREWILQYSLKGCVIALPWYQIFVILFFLFCFVNATTTKTENLNEWFESIESFMSIIGILRNLWIWMSRRLSQTYFECYEFVVNVVLIHIATCTYKSMLNRVQMNQSGWISILLTHSYSEFHEHLWAVKKRFIAHLWYVHIFRFAIYKEMKNFNSGHLSQDSGLAFGTWLFHNKFLFLQKNNKFLYYDVSNLFRFWVDRLYFIKIILRKF